jgi:hypothetical protein
MPHQFVQGQSFPESDILLPLARSLSNIDSLFGALHNNIFRIENLQGQASGACMNGYVARGFWSFAAWKGPTNKTAAATRNGTTKRNQRPNGRTYPF